MKKAMMILMLSASGAMGQSMNLEKIAVGVTFQNNGNTFLIKSFKFTSTATQCFTQYQNQDTRTGYITNGKAEYTATKKDGGIYCSSGKWTGVGQDGRTFSGSTSTDSFHKAGVTYRVK